MDEYFLIGAKRWARRTVSALRMRRLDRRPVPANPDELRLIMVVRNEILRLPYFYDYYRRMGIGRFFVVDNASTDGTVDFLLAQEDTHVFSTAESYVRQEAWVDVLLRRYGVNRWCVVVDVDELLRYPGQDRLSLRDFLGALDEQGADAFHCLLLDMYPGGSLADASYAAGDDFLAAAPFFEHRSIQTQRFAFRNCRGPLRHRFVGGVRDRVFGLKDVCLSKISMVKFNRGMFLRQGTHAVEGATIADLQGVLLHFKYLSDFGPRAQYEAERGEHWNNASQYKAYAQKVTDVPGLSFRCADSVAWRDNAQLTELGLLRSNPALAGAIARAAGG